MTSWCERIRDQGVFASRLSRGDATLSAVLARLSPNVGGPSYQWDKRPSTAAGLMIRESFTEAVGRYVLIQVAAPGKLTCRWRSKSGDPDDNQIQELSTVEMPVHLSLVRASGEVRIYASADGRDWGKPRMTLLANFDASGRIGLFVCSGNTVASATAVFGSVEVIERPQGSRQWHRSPIREIHSLPNAIPRPNGHFPQSMTSGFRRPQAYSDRLFGPLRHRSVATLWLVAVPVPHPQR